MFERDRDTRRDDREIDVQDEDRGSTGGSKRTGSRSSGNSGSGSKQSGGRSSGSSSTKKK